MSTQLSPEVAALIVIAVIWLAVEFRQSRRTRPAATKAPDRCSTVFTFAPLAGVVIGAVLSWNTPEAAIQPPWLVTLIAFVGLICGGALRLWCFRTLGDYFTYEVMTSCDQPVITRGPYRLVRHPSYTGLTLGLVGVVALTSNWLSLTVVAVTTVVALVASIKVEEEVLHRELGDAYRTYAASRPYRLIPFIW